MAKPWASAAPSEAKIAKVAETRRTVLIFTLSYSAKL
jgi:hypothetical protein